MRLQIMKIIKKENKLYIWLCSCKSFSKTAKSFVALCQNSFTFYLLKVSVSTKNLTTIPYKV